MKTLILFDKNTNEVQKGEVNRTIEFYSRLFSNISSFLTSVKVYQTSLQYKGEYFLDCFRNNIDSNFQKAFIDDLPQSDSFDVVITNSCNPIIREVYDYVLNLSIGVFGSKPSFPTSYSLDPWGMYWKSLTYNAPLIMEPNYDCAGRFKKKIADYYSFSKNSNYSNINLFPFNSERLPLHIQDLKKSQVQLFNQFNYRYNQDVHWSQKPNVRCIDVEHTFDYDYLKDLPQDRKINIDSAQLIPQCENIWATHSTLGFQAALHEVNIESPSCFFYWKGEQVGTAGALIDNVFFYDKKSFINRIEKLKQYQRPPERLRQATSSNIHTYTTSDLKREDFI